MPDLILKGPLPLTYPNQPHLHPCCHFHPCYSTPPKPPISFKRLLKEELAAHHENGLCFNCDEKFSRGHRCSSKFFLLITDDDEFVLRDIPTMEAHHLEIEQGDQSQAQISFHTISGRVALETLRLVGCVSNHWVLILIDGGSTYNFIQERLVTTLGLHVQPIQPLRVMVGNDNKIDCPHLCGSVAVHI